MTWLSDKALQHLQRVAMWPDLSGTRYTAIAEIGRGGMGTIYAAHDADLAREVAIKVVNAPEGDEALGIRLHREARVLAALEHPGIVPVHDAGTLPDGRAFYVMKQVRGELLRDHLQRLATVEERLRVFVRVCEPVAFAHARNVVHRDLKPDNVMVGSFGEVLVLDWGLAKSIDQPLAGRATAPPAVPMSSEQGLTAAHTAVGTPGFMPPEQAAGSAAVDQRADVYALGAILFTLLTDSLPEPCSTLQAALQGRRDVPARLRAICAKALATEASARYADAAALAQDVLRFQAGQPVEAYRETWVDRLAAFLRKYRTPILLVLAYLVMRALVAWYSALGG